MYSRKTKHPFNYFLNRIGLIVLRSSEFLPVAVKLNERYSV